MQWGYTQNFWLAKGGGLTIDEALDVATDAIGNTYVTGYFTSTANFSGTNISAAGLGDIFVAKYDNLGQLQWVTRAGGSNEERGTAIAVDASGNVWIGGYFYGNTQIGINTLVSAGAQDIFIAKLDPSGNVLWAARGGGAGADILNGITVDNTGNLIATGEFSGTATFGNTTLNGQSQDIFTLKYNNAGNFLWVKMGTAPGADRGLSVTSDASGNIYVTGQFSNNITFDNTYTNTLVNAIFVVKYSASGNEQWFRKIGGGTFNIAHDIAADPGGNVYITGDFGGNLIFFPNTGNPLTNMYPNRIFLAKYNTTGDFQWAESNGSNNPVSSRSVAVYNNSHVFISGEFECKFNEYADVYGQGTFNAVGLTDIFTARYTTSGTRNFCQQAGGKKTDKLRGSAVANDGNLVLAGSFEENLNVPATANFSGVSGAMQILTNSSSDYCGDPTYNVYQSVIGPGGADIFLGKMIDPLRQPYDFYKRTGNGCSRDIGQGCIYDVMDGICGADSVSGCKQVILWADPQTPYELSPVSPAFQYQWSHGPVGNSVTITNSGYYSVVMTSLNGCVILTDSIYVNIFSNPTALVSDSKHVNNYDSIGKNIVLCMPDSVVITGHTINGNTYYWEFPDGSIYHDSLFTTNSPGLYTFFVINAQNCTSIVLVNVITDYPIITANFEFLFPGDQDLNDSIALCENSYVAYQLVNVPNTQFPPCNGNITITGLITPQNIQIYNQMNCFMGQSVSGTFQPTSTGWYYFNVMIVHKNACDSLTYFLSDSLYIHVNPAPVVSVDIQGPLSFCPGDTITLTATGCGSPSWYGSVIPTLNPAVVMVNTPGVYQATCTVTDSTGCSGTGFDLVNIIISPQPVLTVFPSDGLICPGDSIQLFATGAGIFTWFTPSGQVITDTGLYYVQDAGTYYCAVTDESGCTLITNSVNLSEYTTPFMIASPDLLICDPSDSTVLQVFMNPGSILEWNPPLSGNSTQQVVHQAGTYSCNITSCGITTTSSVTIQGPVAVAEINAAGPVSFCEGDSVILTANTGMNSYIWQPGNINGISIVVTESGTYSLTVADSFGCSITSLPFPVVVNPNHLNAPDAEDILFCPVEYITYQASGVGMLYWYKTNPPVLPVDSGETHDAGLLESADTIYVLQILEGCISPVTEILAIPGPCDTIDMPNVFTPNGDGYNDFVEYFILGSTCFSIQIYNRWGTLIFATDDPAESWYGTTLTGEKCTDGVYYYVLNYCPKNKPPKQLTGFIHLFGS